jgi:hypothetical protein
MFIENTTIPVAKKENTILFVHVWMEDPAKRRNVLRGNH